MNRVLLTTFFVLLAGLSSSASEAEFGLDSNTAFYEGEALTYTMSPPGGLRLVTDYARLDGYSLAFIPEDQPYDSATVIIGFNIYKIRGMTFPEAITADTIAVREHYGANLILTAVDSVFNATDQLMTTFYLDNKTRFIPNVMMSYFDGGTEMVVFELVITLGVTRVEAEETFLQSIERFKALKKGDLTEK